jgi:hypothetical protein
MHAVIFNCRLNYDKLYRAWRKGAADDKEGTLVTATAV